MGILLRGATQMRGKLITVCGIFLLLLTSVFAGDRADFINLGFIDQNEAFLYGQYGMDEDGTYFYADVVYHDLQTGETPAELIQSKRYPLTELDGGSTLPAMLQSVQEYLSVNPVPVDFTRTGVMLYPPGTGSGGVTTFMDYTNNTKYELSLILQPKVRKPETSTRMAITLRQYDTEGIFKQRYDAGSLVRPLEGVYDVRLAKVYSDPERNYLVMVFQTSEFDDETESVDARYLVKSIALN